MYRIAIFKIWSEPNILTLIAQQFLDFLCLSFAALCVYALHRSTTIKELVYMTHSPQDYKSQVLQSKNMRQQSPAVMMSDAVGVPALLITSSVLGTAETAGVSDSVCVDAVSARSDCAETCS